MKEPHLRSLTKLVAAAAGTLSGTSEFTSWFGAQAVADGDLILFNNSFIFRDKTSIKTTKNAQYLCLRVKGGKPQQEVFVAQEADFNTDFKLFSGKSKNLPQVRSLKTSITQEFERLGQLVFLLIGSIKDQTCITPINHSYAAELRFDPGARGAAEIMLYDGARCIVVHQLHDAEVAWGEIEPTVKGEVGEAAEQLATEFAAAFEQLKNEAVSRLELPRPGTRGSETSFIARLRSSVADQCSLYDDALQRCTASGDGGGLSLNEVLRVAYNFADDALKVLQLLVSVADLKAIVLWCTIDAHYDIATAFRNLPWSKSKKKPSLSRYQEIINGARNRAFHNLLAFDRMLESDLQGVSINARKLTLLPAHGRRTGRVAFDYEDRELVEVLTELTLAPETSVSMDFWRRNSSVMRAFESLLVRTETTLRELNRAREATPR